MKKLALLTVLLSASNSYALCSMSQVKTLSLSGAKSLYALTFKKAVGEKFTYTVNAPAVVSQGDNKVSVIVNSVRNVKTNVDGKIQIERVEYSRGYDVTIQSYEDTPCDVRSVVTTFEAG